MKAGGTASAPSACFPFLPLGAASKITEYIAHVFNLNPSLKKKFPSGISSMSIYLPAYILIYFKSISLFYYILGLTSKTFRSGPSSYIAAREGVYHARIRTGHQVDNSSIDFYLVENLQDLCIGGRCLAGYPDPRKRSVAASLQCVENILTPQQTTQFDNMLKEFTECSTANGSTANLPMGLVKCMFAALLRHMPKFKSNYGSHILPNTFQRLYSKYGFNANDISHWCERVSNAFAIENKLLTCKSLLPTYIFYTKNLI